MWKWIVGAALALLVLLAGVCWYGYRRLTAGGDTAVVTIGASPERVFGALADPDSMVVWMGDGTSITAPHRGMVSAGDTLRVEQVHGTHQQTVNWIVDAVDAPSLLVFEMRGDSLGSPFVVRRDSLVAQGDSTTIISTIGSPAIDSLRAVRGDTGGKVGGALINVTARVVTASMRMLSENELKRLKAHLEGKPTP
jgi:uncharacterized protein YndB with AHSA1/START domain